MHKNHFKKFLIIMTMLLICFSFSAYATTTLSSVSLTVTKSGSSVKVQKYASASNYTVKSTSTSSDGDQLTIKVGSNSGYAFSTTFKQSNVSIYGDYSQADVSSVSHTTSTITIVMDISATGSSSSSTSYGTAASALKWNETTGRASWSGNAKKYDVRLYRGSTLVESATTTQKYYSFAKYFTQSGNYTFRVRGVNSDDKGDWMESDELSLTTAEAATIKNTYSTSTGTGTGVTDTAGTSAGSPTGGSTAGAWLQDQYGWWYCNADRSYTVNNWQYINDYWYYFDGNGYMMTGWINWNGNYYYLGTSGNMLTSTWTPDGYYVGADGIWVEAMGHK